MFVFNDTFDDLLANCQSQSPNSKQGRVVGGPCEGCEAIHEFGKRTLNAIDTLPDFAITAPRLKVTGTVISKTAKHRPRMLLFMLTTLTVKVPMKNGK